MNTPSFVRSAGLWCILGALLTMGLSAATFVLPPLPNPSPGHTFVVVLGVISQVLVLLGVIGLARSGAAGTGWLAKIGLGLALLGGALYALGVLIALVNALVLTHASDETLAGSGFVLLGLGLVLVGTPVLRAHRWHGWQRFTPLLAGLYIFLVLVPVIAIAPDPLFLLAYVGWAVSFLLLGVALRSEGAARQEVQPVVA